MRLTHIKLAGFKSFVDPTTLHVAGQLVAVMGPNGCGKSNVIDAVRWVLGEASAKQLRGESMQDVIFNGATTRKAVSRASVELVFDNSDGRLQGAFGQYAEIAIKRVLTRQGQSTYHINNQVVRRRDITDLFLGTGVGARGYAVIEQGMISRIIEARPEELRAHIEEAAGVSKYKERRKETATRLKDTTEHLQRLADIQDELSKQIEKLSQQAQTAERYQCLSQDLTQHQNHMDFVRWQQADAQWQQATEAHEALQQQWQQLQQQATECAEAIYQIQIEEQQSQQNLLSLTEQRTQEREQSARLQTEIEHLERSHQRIAQEQLTAAEQLAQLASEHETLQWQLEEAQYECEQRQIEKEQWQEQLEQLQDAQAAQQQTHADLEQAWQHQHDTANRLERESALLQQQLNQNDKRIAELQQRQRLLQQQWQDLAMPPANVLLAAQDQVALLQTRIGASDTLIEQCEDELKALQDACQHQQTAAQLAQQNLIAINTQHQTISALLPKPNDDGIWANSDAQVLWQHLHVDAKWLPSVQALLRERQHCRSLAPNERPVNAHAISWLTNTLPPNPTLLPDSLAQHITAKADFEPAIAHWFGRIRCVDNLETALSLQGQLQAHEAFITPQAQWVDAVSVQYLHAGQDVLLQHQAQLQELNAQLSVAQTQCQQALLTFEQQKQALDGKQQQLKQAQAQHKQLHEQLRLAHAEATQLLERTQQTQLRSEQLQQEMQQLAHTLESSQQHSELWQQQHNQLQQAQESLQTQLAQLSQQREQHLEHGKQWQLQILEIQRQQGLVTLALQKAQQSSQHYQQNLLSLIQQQQHWQQRQQILLAQLDENLDVAPLQTQLTQLIEHIEQQEALIQAAQERNFHLQAQRHQQHQQQLQLDAQLPPLQAQLQQQLLLQQQAQLNQERFAEQLQQRQAQWEDLVALPSVSLAALQQNIVRLNQQLQALGAVNLAALQELKDATERFDYYQSQRQDIEQAVTLLTTAMAQIDTETKTLFADTFHAVNQHMQTFFPTLFGGGQASLQLVGDDMLEAGVSIMAQPPGKKNATIHLLSGGEKALTAMSLVFALFSLNPAPFCLLDEVDAPLDDANTARFCRLVERMSEHTQFLYVSHNRLTMEMAKQLIGITMQEKGVSRIVEVDIQQAMALAEQTL